MSGLSQGETLIILLLGAIAYFLYKITQQLSYLSGKRIKFGFRFPKFPAKSFKKEKVEEPKLPN